jgi:Protein of unknown function (DUF1203)
MTYAISGLSPEPFSHLFGLGDAELAARGALRVTASANSIFPCRVSLEDARPGDRLILMHYTSHDVPTPYRSSYAIYVRENALSPAHYIDRTPPVFAGRPLGLRGFGEDGMLKDARLAPPGAADEAIRSLFADPKIADIHAHNAAHGCFAAQIDRFEDLGQ